MSLVRAAGVVLFRRTPEGLRFLLLENAAHGTWGFPKGRAEEDETLEACASREVAEETGGLAYVLVPGFRVVTRYVLPPASGGHGKELSLFLGEARGETVRLSPEHARYVWASPKAARELLVHENLRQVLDTALAWLGRA